MITSASLSILNFVSAAAEQGILVKDGRSLELLSSVATVVFDKTGTLTLAQPQVGQIHPCPGYTQDAVLTYAAAAELRQTHPIAHAIVHTAETRGLPLPHLDAAHYQIGYGITVAIDGGQVQVGSVRFMHQEQIQIPGAVQQLIDESHHRGVSVVLVAVNHTLAMKEAAVLVSLRGATTAATDTAHVVLMHQDLSQLLALFDLQQTCQTNTRATMLAILGPARVSVSGALFLGTGLAFTEFINQGSFPLSVATVMWPRWHYRKQENNQMEIRSTDHLPDDDVRSKDMRQRDGTAKTQNHPKRSFHKTGQRKNRKLSTFSTLAQLSAASLLPGGFIYAGFKVYTHYFRRRPPATFLQSSLLPSESPRSKR